MASSMKDTDNMGLTLNEKLPRQPPTFSKGNYKFNWLAIGVLMYPPIVALIAALAGVPLQLKTAIAIVFFVTFAGMIGVTVGYHRLYAHRSYTAHWLVQYLTIFAASGAFQGSAKWWGRNHRIHHRYIDTDKDPYNATRGFWYTHMGWMIMKQDYGILGKVDVSDLKYNRILQFQHTHYLKLALLSGVILPMMVCGLGWGDWLGGLAYAGFFKVFLVHHFTFFINSLAHTSFLNAQQNFSDKHSSHDSWFCALLTFGEGYHNFHHEFAQDYRNGIKWYHFDPTKWTIRTLELLGLAKSLVRTPNSVIERNVNHMQHKKHMRAIAALEKRLKQMEVATPEVWTWPEIDKRVSNGEKIMVIGDYVLDLKKIVPTGPGYTHYSENIVWYEAHPGGRKLLDMYIGKDATEAFTGGIYRHSQGAESLLQHMRVAKLRRCIE